MRHVQVACLQSNISLSLDSNRSYSMGTSTYYMKYTHTYVGLPFGNNTRIPLRVRYSHETVRVIARLSLPP